MRILALTLAALLVQAADPARAQQAFVLPEERVEEAALAVDSSGGFWVAQEDRLYGYGTGVDVLELPIEAERVAVDRQGDLYVVGRGGTGQRIVKLRPSGEVVWSQGIGVDGQLVVRDLAVDDAGQLHLTGHFGGRLFFEDGDCQYVVAPETSTRRSLLVAKYSAEGELYWAFDLPHAFERTTYFDVGPALALDEAGNVYLTGYFDGPMDVDPGEGSHVLQSHAAEGGYTDAFVAKYSPRGRFLHAFKLGEGGPEGFAAGHDVEVGPQGRVYVTGYFQGEVDFDPGSAEALLEAPACFGAFLATYEADGSYRSAVEAVGKRGCSEANAFDVAVGAGGEAYLTGYFFNGRDGTDPVDFQPGPGETTLPYGEGEDIFLARYEPDGALGWAFSLPTPFAAIGYDVEVGPTGDLYTLGSFCASADFDPGPQVASLQAPEECGWYAAAYSPDGQLLSDFTPVAGGPRALAEGDGPVPSLCNVAEGGSPAAERFLIYPNPAASHAQVVVVPAEAGAMRMQVFDALGREVAALFDGEVEQDVTYTFDLALASWPAGVYQVRVQGPETTRTQSFTVVP